MLFAKYGFRYPERWRLDVFLRRWEQICLEGLAPEQAQRLADIISADELAARPELQILVESRAAVDFIDAKYIFAHHEALQRPGLTEQQRLALNQTERDRKQKYRAEMMERKQNG